MQVIEGAKKCAWQKLVALQWQKWLSKYRIRLSKILPHGQALLCSPEEGELLAYAVVPRAQKKLQEEVYDGGWEGREL